jgi:glycosyltransferase involved in cell wall biosynthesis
LASCLMLPHSSFIEVSEGECELILRLRLAREDRVAIVENGIDDQDFEYFPEGFNREDTSQIPLTSGSIMRFTPQKAPGHLIEAFARLVEMSPSVPVRLVIAGDGELFAEAEKKVAASGLEEKVSLLGWRTDVREVLRELDVFVVSSLYDAGLSYSTMEAMAAKLPVVTTNVSCRGPANPSTWDTWDVPVYCSDLIGVGTSVASQNWSSQPRLRSRSGAL